VEIIAYAGGYGIFGISYSAHSAFVHDVVNFLKSGFEIQIEKETPYFSGH
jgi:hypothetical protein